MRVVSLFINTVTIYRKFSTDEPFFCSANEYRIIFVRSMSYLQKLSIQNYLSKLSIKRIRHQKGASDEISLVWNKYIGIVLFVFHAVTHS
jgi:hypothetical protein